MKTINYNPDVLSCLANLSNDEVFTPPEVANQMLDILPEQLCSRPNATFLDPACKTGVFLREIAKRLIKGLATEIPDLQERVDHIFQHQLYAIAITNLTGLLSRRSLYCSKRADGKYSITTFSDADGNIKFERTEHEWVNGRCKYCGASQSEYDRGDELETHAYQFIHTDNPKEIFNMKFDVIIGNPPYQLNDGGSGNGISAKPLYHLFVTQSKKLFPSYLLMIIPSRWFAGGKGLDEFRHEMLNDSHIHYLIDYPKSRECFPNVDIAGGVCYFLWERNYKGICTIKTIMNGKTDTRTRRLNEFDIFIRDNMGLDIIHKIRAKNKKSMASIVYSRNPFGFVSSARGSQCHQLNSIKLYSSAGWGFVNRNEINKNNELIPNYKVFIGKVNPDRGGVNNASDKKMNVTTRVGILNPDEIMTETYLL